MTAENILSLRLANQQINRTRFTTPEQLVNWFGGVQSQDFAMAKWAIGLRLPRLKEADVDSAFNDGKILRTHVLRPTWHFVTPQDIRWMLELTAPRIIQSLSHNYRSFGWDKKFFKKTNRLLVTTLQHGNVLTRDELRDIFQKAKIPTDGLKFIHIMMHAELDGIICSGPKKNKQFTYSLLDERAPNAKQVKREDALAELTRRYFGSHGPATIYDFAWWSGLTIKDVKEGLEMTTSDLTKEVINNEPYWMSGHFARVKNKSSDVYLLPNYDEYLVAYKDRNLTTDKKHTKQGVALTNSFFNHSLIINGQVAGSWKRTFEKDKVRIEIQSLFAISKSLKESIAVEANRYAKFLQMPAVISFK